MKRCLVCNEQIKPFINFGKMPIANGFLKKDDFAKELFYELEVGFCGKCYMVQLTQLIDREKMFHENYAFYSSTSALMQTHFQEFAQKSHEK